MSCIGIRRCRSGGELPFVLKTVGEVVKMASTVPSQSLTSASGQLAALTIAPPYAPPTLSWYVLRHTLRRWGTLAVPLGLVLAVAGAVLAWRLFVPEYRSTVWLRISPMRPLLLEQLPEDRTGHFVQTQVELLKSPVIIERVLKDPQIAELPELRTNRDPKAWIEKRLTVQPVGQSELFRVQFAAMNAEDSARIVTAVVDAYMQLYDRETYAQTERLLELLSKERQDQLQRVNQVQQRVLELGKNAGTNTVTAFNPMQKAFANDPRIQALHDELIRTQLDRDILQAQLTWLKEKPRPATIADAVIQREIDADPRVVALSGQLRARQDTLLQFQVDSTAFRETQEELRSLKTQLQDLRARLHQELPKAKQEQLLAARGLEVASLEDRAKTLAAREESLLQRLEKEKATLEGKFGVRLDLDFAQAELGRAKAVADRIDSRIFTLGLELRPAQRPEQVEVVHAADVPAAPVERFPLKTMAGLSVLGLLLPFGLCLLWELHARRVYDTPQMLRDVRLPLAGEVTRMTPPPSLLGLRGNSRRHRRGRALFEESIDCLRTLLTVSRPVQERQVLAVASAVAGEGKTTLASRLAASWSRHGTERILLIDADLRAPSLHRVFQTNRQPGLGEVLEGACSVEAALVPLENSNFWLLPAGKSGTSPLRLFSDATFAQLVARLRERFDHIIIDSPPVLAAAEAVGALKEADHVLFCVRKDVSRLPQIRLACERLARCGAAVIDAVFIGTTPTHYADRYGEYRIKNR
jgi:succinoglycan biosynthesis transport protein ExoP